MVDYQDLYLKTDTSLLADAFENFIDICLKKDPFHYFSSPELSWDAMLKITKTKLELISDIAMYLFVENGIREGIFFTLLKYTVKTLINT